MKLSIFFIGLCLFISSENIFAYQTEASDYIVLNNEKKVNGVIKIELLKTAGVINFKETGGKEISYTAHDIKEFSKNREVFRSLEIVYISNDNESLKKKFFTSRIVEGPLSLEEVFRAPFEYAITKSGNSKALQKKSINTPSGIEIFKTYQGVFFASVRDCDANIETSKIGFSGSNFIVVVNTYNKCVDPEYVPKATEKIKSYQSEIEISIGNSNSSIQAKGTNPFVKNFESGKEQSLRFMYKRNISNSIVFIGVGLTRVKYTFISNPNSLSNRVSFSEVQLPLNIEMRPNMDQISISIYTGLNLHTKIRGIKAENYVSAKLGGGLGISISESLELGVNLEGIKRLNYKDFQTNPVNKFNFEYDFYSGFFLRYKVLDYE